VGSEATGVSVPASVTSSPSSHISSDGGGMGLSLRDAHLDPPRKHAVVIHAPHCMSRSLIACKADESVTPAHASFLVYHNSRVVDVSECVEKGVQILVAIRLGKIVDEDVSASGLLTARGRTKWFVGRSILSMGGLSYNGKGFNLCDKTLSGVNRFLLRTASSRSFWRLC